MDSTNPSYPAWIPPEFRIPSSPNPSDNLKICESPSQTLIFLAIYDVIEMALFLVLNNQLLKRYVRCGRKPRMEKPWSFSNAGPSLVYELGGVILSSYFTTRSNSNIWRNLQIWSVRPRVNWFKGNMAQVRREWGYMNDALSSVVMELVVCSLSIYSVGNLLHHAWSSRGVPDAGGTSEWLPTMLAACFIMVISTAFEVIWAVYLLVFRLCYNRGRGEADDMDSLKWIARTFVPVTCLCSWLIWAAYLYSSPGAYCPYRRDYINTVWIVVPFLTSGTQLVAGRL